MNVARCCVTTVKRRAYISCSEAEYHCWRFEAVCRALSGIPFGSQHRKISDHLKDFRSNYESLKTLNYPLSRTCDLQVVKGIISSDEFKELIGWLDSPPREKAKGKNHPKSGKRISRFNSEGLKRRGVQVTNVPDIVRRLCKLLLRRGNARPPSVGQRAFFLLAGLGERALNFANLSETYQEIESIRNAEASRAPGENFRIPGPSDRGTYNLLMSSGDYSPPRDYSGDKLLTVLRRHVQDRSLGCQLDIPERHARILLCYSEWVPVGELARGYAQKISNYSRGEEGIPEIDFALMCWELEMQISGPGFRNGATNGRHIRFAERIRRRVCDLIECEWLLLEVGVKFETHFDHPIRFFDESHATLHIPTVNQKSTPELNSQASLAASGQIQETPRETITQLHEHLRCLESSIIPFGGPEEKDWQRASWLRELPKMVYDKVMIKKQEQSSKLTTIEANEVDQC